MQIPNANVAMVYINILKEHIVRINEGESLNSAYIQWRLECHVFSLFLTFKEESH